MKRKSAIVAVLAATTLLASCTSGTSVEETNPDEEVASSPEASVELQISAAASLQNAFTPLIEAFEAANDGVTVAPVNFDGSSTLVEQIVAGDPVDVFASADEANMEKLIDAEMVQGTPRIFATNAIILAVPAENPAEVKEFSEISNPQVKVAVCAPEVPCGGATDRLLEQEDVQIEPVTFEQNVSAVAAKIASGEVDAGFVYQTDVLGSDGKITSIETPNLDPNLYPVAVVEGAENAEAATRFVDFLTSAEGQEILAEFGFGAP